MSSQMVQEVVGVWEGFEVGDEVLTWEGFEVGDEVLTCEGFEVGAEVSTCLGTHAVWGPSLKQTVSSPQQELSSLEQSPH